MNCFLRRVVPRTRGAAYRFGLARRVDGIILNDFESGEIGPDLFCAACHMGLEGTSRSTTTAPKRASIFDVGSLCRRCPCSRDRPTEKRDGIPDRQRSGTIIERDGQPKLLIPRPARAQSWRAAISSCSSMFGAAKKARMSLTNAWATRGGNSILLGMALR
jgi:hypothetical protein